jgi:hypothetical protein
LFFFEFQQCHLGLLQAVPIEIFAMVVSTAMRFGVAALKLAANGNP